MNIAELQPNVGIYSDVSNADYHASQGISSSQIKAWYSTSPLHAKRGKGFTMAQATADKGSAIHALVLEPEKDLVKLYPGQRRAGDAWKTFHSECAGRGEIALPEPDFDNVQLAAQAVRKDPIANAIFTHPNAEKEASMWATDPTTGLLLKARPDCYIPERSLMVDLKSTTRAHPKDWVRNNFYEFGYGLQAYFYQKVGRLNGVNCNNFVFCAVEKEAPYAVQMFRVTPEVMEWAGAIVERVLDEMLADWNNPEPRTGWPDYENIYLPKWLKAQKKEHKE